MTMCKKCGASEPILGTEYCEACLNSLSASTPKKATERQPNRFTLVIEDSNMGDLKGVSITAALDHLYNPNDNVPPTECEHLAMHVVQWLNQISNNYENARIKVSKTGSKDELVEVKATGFFNAKGKYVN